jgi:hypothetical protein
MEETEAMLLRAVFYIDQVTGCTNSKYDSPKLSSFFGLSQSFNFFMKLAIFRKTILLPPSGKEST